MEEVYIELSLEHHDDIGGGASLHVRWRKQKLLKTGSSHRPSLLGWQGRNNGHYGERATRDGTFDRKKQMETDEKGG